MEGKKLGLEEVEWLVNRLFESLEKVVKPQKLSWVLTELTNIITDYDDYVVFGGFLSALISRTNYCEEKGNLALRDIYLTAWRKADAIYMRSINIISNY